MFPQETEWNSRKVEKAMKKREKEAYWGTTCIEKMFVSNSDQESCNSRSSKEGEIWKLGSGELFNVNDNHCSKKLKQHKEFF